MLGHVVHVFVRDDVINARLHIDPAALGAIGRLGGQGYARTADRFEMPMGRAALVNATLNTIQQSRK